MQCSSSSSAIILKKYLHSRDVLQEQTVGGDLFDSSLSKADDQDPSVPGSAFGANHHHIR
jgi:hypothetical protein